MSIGGNSQLLLRNGFRLRQCRFYATTHFGFKEVDENEKSQKVRQVFSNVADKYDLMNDAMSFGIHRLWKDYYVHRLNLQSTSKVLDVAGGTGDISFRVLKALQRNFRGQFTGDVTVCDINQDMLNVGQKKAEDDSTLDRSRISWVCGDAENLPFDKDTFSMYTIAFGIRNCTHVDKVLSEACRVLRPGGKFTCLEFSNVSNPVLRRAYDLYSFQVIPVLGHVLAGDWDSYQYLVESIRKFPNQDEFRDLIRSAGFVSVGYENLSCGVCAIHFGTKRV